MECCVANTWPTTVTARFYFWRTTQPMPVFQTVWPCFPLTLPLGVAAPRPSYMARSDYGGVVIPCFYNAVIEKPSQSKSIKEITIQQNNMSVKVNGTVVCNLKVTVISVCRGLCICILIWLQIYLQFLHFWLLWTGSDIVVNIQSSHCGFSLFNRGEQEIPFGQVCSYTSSHCK